MKYSLWLDRWLKEYVAVESKIKTVVRYEEVIRLHIKPAVGDIDMDELSAATLQSFVSSLMTSGNAVTGGGLSSSSVNGIISVVKKSLYDAYEMSLAKCYVADTLKRPKTQEKAVTCFSLAEQRKMERWILGGDDKSLIGVIVCLYTGLRIGELLGLEWNDVDFDAGLISVTKSRHEGKDADGRYRSIVDTPKTHSSVRTIPISDKLAEVLRDLKKSGQTDYVISDGDKVPCVRTYQRKFAALLRDLDIPYKSFHSLRHTFATRALECGMDVKTLSEILGHKSSVITLSRYAHSMSEHKRNMMNLVGALLSGVM
ncbi:MAG: site-specific integrase [Clostridia bacterium]|nr:site-specific integrase [Clostridia bacterium]